MSQKLDELKELLDKINNFGHALVCLHWDKETIMPREGFESRAKAIDYFSTEEFKLCTSKELKDLLTELNKPEEFNELPDYWQFTVKEMKTQFERDERIPVELYSEYINAETLSARAWVDAKRASDFSIFKPHLEKMIELKKKLVSVSRPGEEIYDAMLDTYEAGMNSETIDRIFGELKEELVPLIKKISEAKKPDLSAFNGEYDIDAEKKVEKFLLNYIGFNFERGTVGETEHPFTTNFDSKDVRVSNHFRKDDCIDPMFSAIHEGGHAIFEQNVNPLYDGLAAGSCEYLGIHESQSRFYENILGRNRNFWLPIYGEIQELQPELKKISLDKFYRMINDVKASYIRTQADEVTYCMHIIIRYEIEKAIFRDGVSVDELPALWNKKMEEYLGIVPSNDAEGILQDMHWSDASFGYFPTYLLGTIYDGMFLETLEKELGPVDKILKDGKIKDITKWLNEKIHKYGSTRKPAEVIEKVCGKEVSAKPIMKYFTEKYTKIYNL